MPISDRAPTQSLPGFRREGLLLVAALSACHRNDPRAAESRADAAAPHFPCAQGSAPLAPDCTAERKQTDKGWIVTIRHPDGHFRRLRVTDDGRGVVAADGAQPATVTPAGPDAIDVAIAGDRYRLPATVRR